MSKSEKGFPFLSLPVDIRLLVYEILLIPPSGTIDLLQTWNYDHGPRLHFDIQKAKVDTTILRVSKQVSREASRVLYHQTILRLRCDLCLRIPFPVDPVRKVGLPEVYSNRGEDKLFADVLRRFTRIRLTYFAGAVHDSEPDTRDIQYHGYKYAYTPCDMRPAVKGFKEILSALAAAPRGAEYGKANFQKKLTSVLQLDLEWPAENLVKRCTADELDEHWKSEGIWTQLGKVQSFRRVEFGGSANAAFNRRWLISGPVSWQLTSDSIILKSPPTATAGPVLLGNET